MRYHEMRNRVLLLVLGKTYQGVPSFPYLPIIHDNGLVHFMFRLLQCTVDPALYSLLDKALVFLDRGLREPSYV